MKNLKIIQHQRSELTNQMDMRCQLIEEKSTQREWILQVLCERSSPFHTGPFQVKVYIGENYPTLPPLMQICEPHRFYHPNISVDGTICHQLVKKTSQKIKIIDRINALINLLQCPNPYSAYNTSAAQIYIKDPRQWYARALLTYQGLKF